VEREASARAWRFLSYNPVAKWTAIAAAVSTGVFFVALLMVLSLFVHLVVYKGRIPSYRDLSRLQQERFQQRWDELPVEDRQQRLQALGVTNRPTVESLATPKLAELQPAEQAFLWRAHIFWTLKERINSAAAARVLPSYWELPPRVRESFVEQWQRLTPTEQMDMRSQLGLEELPPEPERHWRIYLYSLYRQETDPWVMSPDALAYLERRATEESAEIASTEAFDATLADRGALGLVMRTEGRMVGPVLAWLVRVNPWTWRSGNGGYLLGLLLLATVLAIIRALLMFTMTYMAARATLDAVTRLRRAVYHHTFRLATLAFRPSRSNEAVTVFTRHLEAVHDALYTKLTVVFREPVKIVLLLAFALVVHFWLGLAFLLFAVLVWLVRAQVATAFRRRGKLARRRAAEQLALIQESLLLMRLVKIYLMDLFNQSRVERQLARLARAQQRRYVADAVAVPLLILLGTLAALVLLYVGGRSVLAEQIGVPTGITLTTALVSLYWPVTNWLLHRRVLRRGRASAVVLFKFLDRPSEVAQVVGAEFVPPLQHQLELDDVSLKEPGTGRTILRHVNLTIQAGQRVALVGPNEIEKHALIYLIPRLLDPTSGQVRIDEHNLRWVTLDSLRAQIGVVIQKNLVFNDTVANNIGCGDPGYTLPQIIEAAKIAHAHQFIQKLPHGYETPIGELGHPLTVGQQFLIALARALLRDPALLIIEEPIRALDEDTKHLLDDTFARILPGRTVIFLPHRPSTIRSCDRIFLLHRGRIEAAGGHRELLEENELYRHLHYIEFNEVAEQV
jgi:ATP-binding cassette, subfamily B, bacterial